MIKLNGISPILGIFLIGSLFATSCGSDGGGDGEAVATALSTEVATASVPVVSSTGASTPDTSTPEKSLTLLKNPTKWKSSGVDGFGPSSGEKAFSSGCKSWTYLGSYSDYSKHFTLLLVIPGGKESSFLSDCSDADGLYKLVARPLVKTNADVVLATLNKNVQDLINDVKSGKDWVGDIGDHYCSGFKQKVIPSASYCVSWQYNGAFQSRLEFELHDDLGAVIDTGGYLYACGNAAPSLSIHAKDKVTGLTTLLHTVTKATAPALDLSCKLELAQTSGGTSTSTPAPSTVTYKVKYLYKFGETYADYYCRTAGEQQFNSGEIEYVITKDAFDIISTRTGCTRSLTDTAYITCVTTSNCTSTQYWCAKGNVYEGNYRSGYWIKKVCSTPRLE